MSQQPSPTLRRSLTPNVGSGQAGNRPCRSLTPERRPLECHHTEDGKDAGNGFPDNQRRGARAPALASTGTIGNPWSAGWEGDHTEERAKDPATGATGLHRLLLCFFPFLERGSETRCSCCRGAGLLVCVGGAKAAWATPPGRVWWRFALALAHRPAPRRTSRAAQRQHGPVCDTGPAFMPLMPVGSGGNSDDAGWRRHALGATGVRRVSPQIELLR